MQTVKLPITLLVVFILSGCIQYSLVPAGEVNIKDIKVTTGMAWNKSPFKLGPNTTVWTADGESLNQVIFIQGVGNGQTVFKDTNKDVVMPKFSDSILLHEIEDLLVTSITNLYSGQITVEPSNLKPVSFNNKSGIQFDLRYYTIDGMAIRGKAKAAISEGKLYAIIYTAADLHYYEKYEAEVDALLDTASIDA